MTASRTARPAARGTARTAVLRAGLGLLAVTQGAAALWQLLGPRSFYDDGPVPGAGWVALTPPYSEHLMRDVGALSLGMALGCGVAAVLATAVLVRTVLAMYLCFAAPHLAFHATHLMAFAPGAAVAQTALLAVAVVLPVLLLALTRGRDHGGGAEGRRGHSVRR